MFMDLVPNLIIILCFAAIINTNFKEYDAFPDLLLVIALISLCYQSLGYLIAILSYASPMIGCMIIFCTIMLFNNFAPSDRAFSVFARKLIDCISPVRLGMKHIFVLFYGFDRCSEDEISSAMFQLLIFDDDFDKSTHLLIFSLFLYYSLTYICFKVRVNWDSIQMKIIDLRTKLNMQFL